MFKKALSLTLILMLPLAAMCLPQQSAPPTWTPPNTRLKAETFFAPRSSKGNNIFDGDAERWLADSIIELETEVSTPIEESFIKNYVAEVGKHLVAHSPVPTKAYEFIVTEDENENAWTAGGGRIFINLGMLRNVESEDELAGVLAHELGHDTFGHAPKTVTRQLFWMKGISKVRTRAEVKNALAALFSEYSKKPLAAIAESLVGFHRIDELEADRAAFYILYKAGYNPRALSILLKRIESDSKSETGDQHASEKFITLLFGTHPPTSQRSLAFSWEANFVKMPAKDARYLNSSFDEMKKRLANIKT